MARRPIFMPKYDNGKIVEERELNFSWSPGFAEVQKKRNIEALHAAAKMAGIQKVLEISSKSPDRIGRRLSAFSLKLAMDGKEYPLESVYQGSKVFEGGGPFPDVYHYTPREAKKFIRDKKIGNLIGFEMNGERYPLSPKNAFYDWIYIRALKDHADWISRNVHYDAFTDIEFNPEKQVNCQARAFAEYMALLKKSKLSGIVDNFNEFASMIRSV